MQRGGKWFISAVVTTAVATAVSLVVTKGSEKVVADRGAPVAIQLLDDPATIDAFNDTGLSMIAPDHPAGTVSDPEPGLCAGGFRDWALGLGGSDSKVSRFRLVLQGRSDRAVLIAALTARVLGTKPAGSSVELVCPTAGGVSPRTLSIDLDAARPAARYMEKGHKQPFGFTLAKGETEVFDVTARTARAMVVEWRLDLELSVDGKRRVVGITDRGKAFRTCAASAKESFSWFGGRWVQGNGKPAANPFAQRHP